MAGEGGLLVGYGGCGRPGLGLGCAESLPGVPRLYEYQRFLEDVKTISVYQKHNEKTKIFKIKIYFYKLLILNRYVSNLQVPTTSESPWGKVNVSKFMDFAEIRLLGRKKHTFGTIKKNNCYLHADKRSSTKRLLKKYGRIGKLPIGTDT